MTTTLPGPEIDAADDMPDTYLSTPKGAAIISLLRKQVSIERVVAIGRYRKTWTLDEVLWVKRYYIDRLPIVGQWVPIGYAPQPQDDGPLPPRVNLSHRQVEVLAAACWGQTRKQIATELGLFEQSVACLIREVVAALGAIDLRHAVRLTRTGQVRIFVTDRRGVRS
jgi:DNA-binding CsgD family transcriptional regulator